MSNIKGITIEIDGKTTGLEKSLASVNKESAKANAELSKINNGLKFNPGNSDLVAQKQQVLAKQIEVTSEKLNALKNADSQVKQSLANGEIGEDKYRAFQRELVETESKLRKYKTEMASVGQEQKNWQQSSNQLQTLLKATKTSLDDYSNVLGTKLVNSIKNGSASSADLDKAIKLIGKASGITEHDIDKLKKTLDTVDDGNSLDNVASEMDKLKNKTSESNKELEKISKATSGTALMQAASAAKQAGDAVIGFAKQSQDAFRQMDEGLDIYTTKTGQSSDAIKASYERILSSIPVDSPAIVGAALGEVNTQLDFTGERLEAASLSAIKFANINGTDVSNSIISAKQALEAYGLSNEQFESVLDSVTGTAQRTGVSVDALFQSAVAGAPQIKSLGLSFGEGVELMGQFNKLGIDGSNALGLLSKASVVYAKQGISLKDGLAQTIDKIKNAKSETEALATASATFGTKGAAKMVDAIKRGAFSFSQLTKAAKDSQGSVSATFDATLDDIDQQQIAMQQFQAVMAEVGGTIASAVAPLIKDIVPVIKDVVQWLRDLPAPVQQGILVVGGLLAGLSALAPVITAIATVFGVFGASIGAALLPIGAIVAAIAAVIAIIANWDTICQVLSATWDALVATGSAVWSSLVEVISGFVQGASEALGGVGSFISGVWNEISTTTSNIWNGITSTISNTINGARDAVGSAIEAIKGFLKFEWKWPKIPLPHFTFSGSLNPLDWGDASKRPNVGVEWYAKGGILNAPTVFGMNGNNLMVGGEAGSEAVLPLNAETLGGIGRGIAATMNTGRTDEILFQILDGILALLDKDTSFYMDGQNVARVVSPYLNSINTMNTTRNQRIKGGKI